MRTHSLRFLYHNRSPQQYGDIRLTHYRRIGPRLLPGEPPSDHILHNGLELGNVQLHGKFELPTSVPFGNISGLQMWGPVPRLEVTIWTDKRTIEFLPRNAMQARPMSSCGVCLSMCLSVCLSVTFVTSVKTNKHGIKVFSPSGSHTILVFPRQTA